MGKLTIRDLVTIGIFTGIIYILMGVVGFGLTIVTPIRVYIETATMSLLTMLPYLVMCRRIAKPGVILIFNVVLGILLMFMGMWYTVPFILVAALISEWLLKVNNGYKSNKLIVFSHILHYVVVNISMIIPFTFFREKYISALRSSKPYANEMIDLYLSVQGQLFVGAITVVFSLVAAYISIKMVNKHFTSVSRH
ncbi:MptD family putative ECF transporter S component [Brochothrix thermosphacta]|uniref:MptD family putative ECF transporter S component n=1 Tax=Brochothrix thermosphacta TaxID=2756 RepID=UPI0039B0B476